MTKSPPTVSLFSQEKYAAARRETERLSRELDITNADHVALWLEANLGDASLGWLAVPIVEAHEAAHTPAPDTRLPEGISGNEARIASIIANVRQGRSDTPRCEPPSQYAVNLALQDVKDVKAALDTLAAHTPHPAVEVTEKRAREVLRQTAHDQDCPYNMSEWNKAIFSSSELLEMGDCRCDQVIRAMLAFAASASTTEDGV